MFRSYRDGAVLADTAVGELLGTGVLSLCHARSASSSGICDLSGIADSFSNLDLLFHRTDKAGPSQGAMCAAPTTPLSR